MKKTPPSMDLWLKEAKEHYSAPMVGMYLTHNGVVRESTKAKVRLGVEDERRVKAMLFSYDEAKLNEVLDEARTMQGIYYIRAWLNEGELAVGDDIMYVLIGGDIRPNVVEALQFLVGLLKSECVTEQEKF